jgi:hypothetical protein
LERLAAFSLRARRARRSIGGGRGDEFGAGNKCWGIYFETGIELTFIVKRGRGVVLQAAVDGDKPLGFLHERDVNLIGIGEVRPKEGP